MTGTGSMSQNIIFLHNRLMDYRFPLFKILKDEFQDRLEFWFYHDNEKDFPGRYFPAHDFKIQAFSHQLVRQFSYSCIRELIRENNHGTIILNGAGSNYELPLFFLLARVKRKRLVFWTEAWNWGKMNSETYFFHKLISFIARHVDIVLYPGQKVKNLYDGLGIPASRQIFIPNASNNPHPVDPDYVSEVVRPTPGKVHVVFLGRIGPRKGLQHLIEAMKILSPNKYELIVGGTGGGSPFEQRCLQIAGTCSNIRFCGEVKKEYVNSILTIADVYVYPSVNLHGMGEPWGLTLNEAVALGKRCVATEMVAAAYDLIEDGKNGFIVSQNDPKALATAIEAAATLPQDTVREVCQRKSAVYSYENMAQGFITAVCRLG